MGLSTSTGTTALVTTVLITTVLVTTVQLVLVIQVKQRVQLMVAIPATHRHRTTSRMHREGLADLPQRTELPPEEIPEMQQIQRRTTLRRKQVTRVPETPVLHNQAAQQLLEAQERQVLRAT